MSEEKTKKIDYRYYTNYPISSFLPVEQMEKFKDYFWFAAYDKLMNKHKMLSVLNYYGPLNENEINFQEKVMMLKDFDIYFRQNNFKPYIKYVKGGYIFVKLYLLSLEQISNIIKYKNTVK